MNEPRRPPHSNEAEQALLGAVMLAGIGKVAAMLVAEDFYPETHRLIWRACMEIDAAGERVDVVSVAEWFSRHDDPERIQHGAYLTQLANEGPGTANMTGWAKTIKQKAVLRGLIDLSVDLGERAMSGEEPEAIVSDMTEQLLDWTGSDTFTGPKLLIRHAADWLDQLNQMAADPWRADTGLVDVDRLVMGLMGSELGILAGRPGSGKSSMGLQVAKHVSRDRPVLFFSLEMSGFELVGRFAAAGIPPERLRNPKDLTGEDWAKIKTGLQMMKAHKLIIDDTGGLSINQVSARARYAHRQHGLALIVVDYLQLINAPTGGNRTEEISVVSRALKKLAKDLKVPVLALSQLNRGLESRPDKRPLMSDLRESGQVEQDADQIWFLYRHAYYYPDCGSDISELILAKHRHAQPGKAFTLWQGNKTRFVNADWDLIEDYKSMLTSDSDQPRRKTRFQKIAGGSA